MKKRLLSIVLSFVLILSILPTALVAFAVIDIPTSTNVPNLYVYGNVSTTATTTFTIPDGSTVGDADLFLVEDGTYNHYNNLSFEEDTYTVSYDFDERNFNGEETVKTFVIGAYINGIWYYTNEFTVTKTNVAASVTNVYFKDGVTGEYESTALNPVVVNEGTNVMNLTGAYFKVELTGGDTEAFTCGWNSGPGAISSGDYTEKAYIRTNEDLDPGTYTATYTIYYDIDGNSGTDYDFAALCQGTATFKVFAPAPVITIDENGVATWTTVDGAVEYNWGCSSFGGLLDFDEELSINIPKELLFYGKESGTYTFRVYAVDENRKQISAQAEAVYEFTTDKTYIDSANVQIATPVAGEKPSFTAIPDGEGYTVNVKNWYDVTAGETLTEEDTFIGGHSYQVRLQFIAEEGYALHFSTSYTVNGLATRSASSEFGHRVIAFNADVQEIDTIEIEGILAPEFDQSILEFKNDSNEARENGTFKVNGNSGEWQFGNVLFDGWTLIDKDGEFLISDSSLVDAARCFEEGTYTMWFFFGPDEGYVFADDLTVTVKGISNDNVAVEPSEDGWIAVSVKFDVKGPTPIESLLVNASGYELDAPVDGVTVTINNENIEFINDPVYGIFTDMDIDAQTCVPVTSGNFKADVEYWLVFPISAKEGYDISQITKDDITINGIDYDEIVAIYYAEYGILEIFVKLPKLSTSEPDPTYTVGDINGNGKIDARDYLLLKRAYFGTYTLNCAPEAADINGNGKIDARDYLLLKRAYFGTYTIK